jgi:hypothetical protein
VAAVQLQNPAGHVVEKVAVVGHGDDRAGVALQVVFQPGHAFGVQVVGRLVQQQDVGLLQQQAAQGHAALSRRRRAPSTGVSPGGQRRASMAISSAVQVPGVQGVELFLHFALALDQFVHLIVAHRLGELVVDLLELLEQVDRFLHALLDDLAHRLVHIDQRFLLEKARRCTPGERTVSPLNSLSTPAMMRSSELLPEPLRPSTPILAP